MEYKIEILINFWFLFTNYLKYSDRAERTLCIITNK